MKKVIVITLAFLLFVTEYQIHANQLTPRPTVLQRGDADIRTPRPREMSNFRMPVVEFDGVRLEATSDPRFVFSSTEGFDDNRRLYYWEPGFEDLIDTELEGVSRSVVLPDDGRYMIYLYDELDDLTDINGDNEFDQVLLRFYHFDSARHVTIGVPARSGVEEVKEIPEEPQSKREFEYNLVDDQLLYSVSPRLNNNSDSNEQLRANWQVVDLDQVIYEIVGTPTPTFSPTPSPTITPTATATATATISATATVEPTVTDTPTFSTPAMTPTPTGFPTVPPELRTSADLNNDEVVDTLDLLLFQLFWRESTRITPTPTIGF